MYRIMGKSRFGTEELDTATDEREADFLVGEYRTAYGSGWNVWWEMNE